MKKKVRRRETFFEREEGKKKGDPGKKQGAIKCLTDAESGGEREDRCGLCMQRRERE